ncbi:MAG: YdcF family protein [Prochloraceae cyanobacterium]
MNFIFFSKLVPLFLYPLGLTCILLIVTLLLLRKYAWGLPSLSIAVALLVLCFASNGWVSNFLARSLEWQNIPPVEITPAEAIVLLGGATKSASFPRPMVDISEEGDRIIYAAKLYQDAKAPLIIAAGGRIAWRGGGQPESADMAQLLGLMGVPLEAIVQEPNSLNTYQNAVNVRQILADREINRVLLVTSAMHMPRSLMIFQRQGIEAIPAPTDFLVSQQDLEELTSSTQAMILNLLPDARHLETTTKAIKEYLGIVVYRLRGWL